jgi:hypothetical protein
MARIVSAALVATLALVLLGGFTTRAQEATPGSTGLPVTPDPSECTVQEPTFQDLLDRIGATPVPAGMATGTEEPLPAASPAAFTLPPGTPADAATVAAITALMREVVACLNTGHYLTLFYFVSDSLLRQFEDEDPITEADVAAFSGTPEALDASQYATLVAVRQVVVLPDGRVGALVDTIFPDEQPGVQTEYFAFVQEDGQWRIDEVVEDLEGQYPPEPMGTPAAA